MCENKHIFLISHKQIKSFWNHPNFFCVPHHSQQQPQQWFVTFATVAAPEHKRENNHVFALWPFESSFCCCPFVATKNCTIRARSVFFLSSDECEQVRPMATWYFVGSKRFFSSYVKLLITQILLQMLFLSGSELPFSEYIVELCSPQAHSCVIYFIHLYPLHFCMHNAFAHAECALFWPNLHSIYSVVPISIIQRPESVHYADSGQSKHNCLINYSRSELFFFSSLARHSLMDCEMLQLQLYIYFFFELEFHKCFMDQL